jgi:hypothetical protein
MPIAPNPIEAVESSNLTRKRDFEEPMNTLSRNKLTDAVGPCTAIAGVLLLAAMVIPGDPLGRLIGALIGASLLAGIAGAFVREGLAHRDHVRRTTRAALLRRTAPAAAVAMPRLADATASEFDGRDRPAFAPVISLTEAQVERGRAAPQRQKRLERGAEPELSRR